METLICSNRYCGAITSLRCSRCNEPYCGRHVDHHSCPGQKVLGRRGLFALGGLFLLNRVLPEPEPLVRFYAPNPGVFETKPSFMPLDGLLSIGVVHLYYENRLIPVRIGELAPNRHYQVHYQDGKFLLDAKEVRA